MANLYLIRHGQASFDKDDYDQLSELGFQQARHLGDGLKAKVAKPDLIVSGTMRRHQETAHSSTAAFTEQSIPQVQLISNWNEFDHQNVIAALNPAWENSSDFRRHISRHESPERYFMQLFSEGLARWVSGENDADYKEPWAEFKARVLAGFESVAQLLPANGNAFVFTSGGPISSLVMSLLNLPDENLLKINRTLVNCGVTKIRISKNGSFLSTLNEHAVFDSPQHRHMITYK